MAQISIIRAMTYTVLHGRGEAVVREDAGIAVDAYRLASNYIQKKRPDVRIVAPDGASRAFVEFERAFMAGEIRDGP